MADTHHQPSTNVPPPQPPLPPKSGQKPPPPPTKQATKLDPSKEMLINIIDALWKKNHS